MTFDSGIDHTPEEAAINALEQPGLYGSPISPGSPTPPAAEPAATTTPAAFPAPNPDPAFALPVDEPEPEPDISLLSRQIGELDRKITQPAPAVAPAEAAKKFRAEAILADKESSDEARALAQDVLDTLAEQKAASKRMDVLEAKFNERAEAEQRAEIASIERDIETEKASGLERFNISPDEVKKIDLAWANAVQKEPGLAKLRWPEAARRFLGDEGMEARRKGAASPAPPPQTQRPQGSMIPDVTSGTTARGPVYTPPTDRPRGVSMDEVHGAVLQHLGLDRQR